jgi:hypothetical protein
MGMMGQVYSLQIVVCHFGVLHSVETTERGGGGSLPTPATGIKRKEVSDEKEVICFLVFYILAVLISY